MHIGFLACYLSNAVVSAKSPHFISCPCSTEAVGIAHKPPRSLYSARIVADKQTNKQTERQTDRQTHRTTTVTLAAHANEGTKVLTLGAPGPCT